MTPPGRSRYTPGMKLVLWIVLLLVCWPLALVVLVMYPFLWLLLLPFRVVGVTVDAMFDLFKTLLFLPARILRGPKPR